MSFLPGFSLRRTETVGSDDDRNSIRSSGTFSGAAGMGSSVIHAFRRLAVDGGAEYKEYWMADDSTDCCEACKQPFHTFRRRHHCRACGLIFCSQCAYQFIPGLQLGLPELAVRICNECWKKTNHSQIRGKISAPINNATLNLFANTPSPPPSEAYSDSEYESDAEGKDEEASKGAPFRRKRLRSATTPSIDKVVEKMDFFGPPRKRRVEKSRIRTEEQTEEWGEGRDEGAMEPMMSKAAGKSKRSLSVTLQQIGPSVNENRADTPLGAFIGSAKLVSPGHQLSETREYRDRKDSFANYAPIPAGEEMTMLAFDYLRLMIHQNLTRLQVPRVKVWEHEMIRLLIKVAKYVKLDISKGDPMDIRNFVKIKKVPGGRITDSEYVDGYVCSKNLLHKQMERSIQSPKIILCDLGMSSWEESEEERRRKDLRETGFEQLADIMKVEDKRVRALTSLGSYGAEVILFSFKVPRLVLDILSRKGISVAHDVKPRTMQAVKRMTNSGVITAAEMEMYIDKLDEEKRRIDKENKGLLSPSTTSSRVSLVSLPPITCGTCHAFKLHTFVHPFITGRRKTIMRFEGCQKDLGCSLIIRGDNLEHLENVKRTLDMMVQLVYSLKLECHLLKEEGAGPIWPLKFDRGLSENDGSSSQRVKRDFVIDISDLEAHSCDWMDISKLIQDSMRPYTEVYLSGSPSVRFQPPWPIVAVEKLDRDVHILRRKWAEKEAELLGNGISELIAIDPAETTKRSEQQQWVDETEKEQEKDVKSSKYQTMDGIGSLGMAVGMIAQKFSLSDRFSSTLQHRNSADPTSVHIHQAKLDKTLIKPSDRALQSKLQEAELRRTEQLKAWATYMKVNQDKFTPEEHQNICILSSTISTQSNRHCRGPHTEMISFYNVGDFTMGQVIEKHFEEMYQLCPAEKCGQPNHKHCHTWVHGHVRITMQYEVPFPKDLADAYEEMGEDIQMASSCNHCDTGLHWSYVSQETWRYSFGKFLETCFYPDSLVAKRSEGCQHNPILDYTRRFVKDKRLALVFSAEKIHLADIVVPPLYLRISLTSQLRLRNEEYKSLYTRNTAFWDSVVIRIRTFNFDTIHPDYREASKAAMMEIAKEAEESRVEIVEMLDKAYRDCHRNGMSLNLVRRVLQTKASKLDSAFSDFDKSFPLCEGKLTANQIRKLFDTSNASDRASTSSVFPPLSETSRSGFISPGSDCSGSEAASPVPFSRYKLSALEAKIDKDLAHSGAYLSSETSSLSDSVISDPPETTRSTLKAGMVSSIPEEDSGDDSDSTARGVDLHNSSAAEAFNFSEDSDAGINTEFRKPRSNAIAQLVKMFDPAEETSNVSQVRRPKFVHSKTDTKIPRRKVTTNKTGVISDGEEIDRMPDQNPVCVDHQFNTSSKSRYVSPRRESHTTSAQSAVRNPQLPKSRIIGPPTKPKSRKRGNVQEQLSDPDTTGNVKKGRSSMLAKISPIEKGTISLPEKKTKTSIPSMGKVSSLARRWEQFGRAHAQQNRFGYRRKARPVATTRPTVQVFENVRDAVLEDSDDERRSETAEADDGYEGDKEEDEEFSNQSRRLPHHSNMMNTSHELPTTTLSDQSPTPSANNDVSLDQLSPSHLDPTSIPTTKTSSDTDTSSVSPIANKSSYFSDTDSHLGAVERGSIMKAISNFWNYRQADYAPLEYPLTLSEHIFQDNIVTVREDEPSSILAFVLSSESYRNTLLQSRDRDSDVKLGRGKSEAFMPDECDDTSSSRASTWEYLEAEPRMIIDDLEERLCSPRETSFRLDFGAQADKCKFYAKVLFPDQFEALRLICKCNEQFVESLSRCSKWESTGGKSGSAFFKTKDDRFIIKEVSKQEVDSFMKFAPDYFGYMARAHFKERVPTLLAKIFGVYRIGLRNPSTNKSIKLDVLVMENLMYDRVITKKFDLKGSLRNRHVQPSAERANHVLLDENLIEIAYKEPLFVREFSKRHLRTALFNDTLFLSKNNIMDYSLVVGIDYENEELVVGIIDFIRTYTWDKKLETWVKESALLGNGGKGEPTVITPRQYRTRFRDAMERYFIMVPDKWIQLKSLAALVATEAKKRSDENESYFDEDWLSYEQLNCS